MVEVVFLRLPALRALPALCRRAQGKSCPRVPSLPAGGVPRVLGAVRPRLLRRRNRWACWTRCTRPRSMPCTATANRWTTSSPRQFYGCWAWIPSRSCPPRSPSSSKSTRRLASGQAQAQKYGIDGTPTPIIVNGSTASPALGRRPAADGRPGAVPGAGTRNWSRQERQLDHATGRGRRRFCRRLCAPRGLG